MKSFWNELPRPFFVLAPMEAVTDVVFRHVIAATVPPDVWFTEFTNATGWYHAGDKAIGGRLIKTDDEHPIVAQLWGADPIAMEALAKHCAEMGFDGIDINMGCPVAKEVKTGGGAGMILNPENAAVVIAAAKKSGLPVSVKTRLGYTRVDEWTNWITHILSQDIVNFTIHLRTRKEMSKVPAHYELIPEIKKLRDEIAPQTLLTINGDIRDHAHGVRLVEQYGVDGIMIGRGIFANPFAFAAQATVDLSTPLPSSQIPSESARRSLPVGPANGFAPSFEESEISSKVGATPTIVTHAGEVLEVQLESGDTSKRVARESEQQERIAGDSSPLLNQSDRTRGAAMLREPANDASGEDRSDGSGVDTETIKKKIDLLRLHLDLYDQYSHQTGRPYETLKRFYKIYIRDFDGASELRDKLMHTTSTDEVRQLIDTIV